MNEETTIVYPSDQIETVVGDEKQAEFYPRIKVKKWNNEVNFSIGLQGNDGDFVQEDDRVVYTDDNVEAIFEPTAPRTFDNNNIRYVYSGALTPNEIAAVYELDREVTWDKQTINIHYPDRYALMYFGYYPRDRYIDPAKLDLDECRLSAWQVENGPMVMDDGLLMIDIHYDHRRDDLLRINMAMKDAVREVLEKYGVNHITENPKGLKLYFQNEDGNPVKFFSTAYIAGHYYFYINLNTDYNASHNYYRDDVTPETEDELAYGLLSQYTLPDKKTLADELVAVYAREYGLPYQEETFTAEEKVIIQKYATILSDRNWIENAERTDPYYVAAWDKETKGFIFDMRITEPLASNVINLTIKHKNLRFLKQPLEIGDDVWQEPRVVNSYAVYHAENKQNNEYETGKAFHIYRPWIEDADKNRVWCELDIPVNEIGIPTSELATLTIPQDFLDTATYPLYIDPTFGYSSAGAIASNIYNDIEGSVYAAGIYKLNSIVAYLGWSGAVSIPFSYAIYDNADNTLKTEIATINTTQNFTGWITLNASDQTTEYNIPNVILAVAATISAYSLVINFYYDVDNSVTYKAAAYTYATPLPSPQTWTTSTTGRKYSIYANTTVDPRTITITDGTANKRGVRIWQ